jgi:DNA mismatch endonuclease (patch repair protein)
MSTNTEHKEYIRDKRSPEPKDEKTSRVMRANKAKDSGPEILLRKQLWQQGKRGYRLHKRIGNTRPDIVFSKAKVAVFVNGCYWHHCPHCKLPLPKNNTDFWKKKFETNTQRDARKIAELKKMGWKTVTVWECKLKKNVRKETNRVIAISPI